MTSSQLLQPCDAPHLFGPGAQTHGSLRTKVKVPAYRQGLLQGTINESGSEYSLVFDRTDIQEQDEIQALMPFHVAQVDVRSCWEEG